MGGRDPGDLISVYCKGEYTCPRRELYGDGAPTVIERSSLNGTSLGVGTVSLGVGATFHGSKAILSSLVGRTYIFAGTRVDWSSAVGVVDDVCS